MGGNAFQHVDVRITAATNQNLIELIKQKKFRSDLYWRLNIIKVTIPPLRERKEDIILLANYFLKKNNQKYGTSKLFDKKMMYLISDYDWPGNIRQLKNAIERLVVYSEPVSYTHLDVYKRQEYTLLMTDTFHNIDEFNAFLRCCAGIGQQ